MKIDRLIGILAVLLQQDKVTAASLAEKFEVSRRTISRDIEHLAKAGIPVTALQGKNGGIMIMDGYKFDSTLFTQEELQAILTGLRGLDSVARTREYRRLIEKISADDGSPSAVTVDLASWYRDSLAPKFERIRQAIRNCELLCFHYLSPGGEGDRMIEPYRLVYRWSSWYIWGYDTARQDYRTFKLNRMQNLNGTGERFARRELPPFEISSGESASPGIAAKILFAPQAKWRLNEEFGPASYQEQEDGSLLFTFGFTDREYLTQWLLSFGIHAELLEPRGLRAQLCRMAKEIMEKYQKTF